MGIKKADPVVIEGKTFPKKLTDGLGLYLEHMADRKYAPASVKKRKNCVMRFIDHLHGQGVTRWQDVTPTVIDRYRIEVLDHGYSPHTVYAYVHSFRVLFEFLEERGILFDNPARGLVVSKPKPQLGLVLTEKEIHDLLARPDLTTPWGIRDRALLEVFYGAGLRLGECAALTIYDVDVDNQTLKVMGKGSKQRIIPVGKHAAKYLKIYLREARRQLIRDNLPPEELWMAKQRGRPIGMQAIRLIVKRHAEAANLPDETDTHCLRRTCATHMLRGGAHPVAVAQMLGHSDLSSLAHYLKTTIEDMMGTHSNSKPGE